MMGPIIDEDLVLFINTELRRGLQQMREAEEKYGCLYTMQFELNKQGNVQLHLRPEDQPGVTA